MVTSNEDATVLVVDDEESVADAYASQLQKRYSTKVAYTGSDALQRLDESIDIVLLDRRMPGLSGDEVLQKIRDSGYNCRIIMVSAVDPELEIAQMPFDEYLCKPVTKTDLFEAIERQLFVSEYDERVPEFVELKSKIEVLEENQNQPELDGKEEYEEMQERASELEEDIRDVIDNFDEVAVDLKDYV
jgi:CheY-like chemotaxis protein